MKNLLKKFRENKKGFTLAELLVVVAIIGILVAVSIPVFTAQLSKARMATNLANLRAAKAAAVAEYLSSEAEGEAIYNFDIASGEAVLAKDDTANSKKQASSTERTLDPQGDDQAAYKSDKFSKFSVKVTTATTKDGTSEVVLYADK